MSVAGYYGLDWRLSLIYAESISQAGMLAFHKVFGLGQARRRNMILIDDNGLLIAETYKIAFPI